MYTTYIYDYGGDNNVNATEVTEITEIVTNNYTTLNDYIQTKKTNYK